MEKKVDFTDTEEIEQPRGTHHLLAIAIDAYTNGIRGLNNCVHDAKKVVALLTEKYHFEEENTTFLKNETATYKNIIQSLEDFNKKLGENDTLLIYFSGHGTFSKQTNLGYLLPVDAHKEEVHTYFHQIVLKAYLKAYKAKHILLILDSCYSGAILKKKLDTFTEKTNKLPSRWVLTSGHLETVSDGDFGKKHSPFAEAILDYLQANTQDALSISELILYVTKRVANNQKQTPHGESLQDANHGGGLFFFFLKHQDKTAFFACKNKKDFEDFVQKHKNSAFLPQAKAEIAAFLQNEAQDLYEKIVAAAWEEKPQLCKQFKDNYRDINRNLYKEVIAEGKKANDYLAWQKVNKKDEFAVETFLLDHEDCFFVTEIEAVLANLEAEYAQKQHLAQIEAEEKRKKAAAEQAERELLAAEAARKAAEAERLQEEAERKAKEDPFHGLMVKIPGPSFEMCKYQVTQKQWELIMGNNPSRFKGENLPVECVSWDDIQVFLQKLNEKTGKNYRLPSEAEWEYAAKGGQEYEYAGSDNPDEVAWYWENSGDKKLSGEWKWETIQANNCRTHPVGQKKANGYSLYDMSGNVWEWCEDWYDSDKKFKVLRGGSWVNYDYVCRVSNRVSNAPNACDDVIGFRVVR